MSGATFQTFEEYLDTLPTQEGESFDNLLASDIGPALQIDFESCLESNTAGPVSSIDPTTVSEEGNVDPLSSEPDMAASLPGNENLFNVTTTIPVGISLSDQTIANNTEALTNFADLGTPEWVALFDWFMHYNDTSYECSGCSACLFLCPDMEIETIDEIARNLDGERVSAAALMSMEEVEALMKFNADVQVFEGGKEELTYLKANDQQKAEFDATTNAIEQATRLGNVGLAIRLRHSSAYT